MPKSVYVGGWRPVIRQWVMVSGTWRPVKREWVMKDGAWRLVGDFLPPDVSLVGASFYQADSGRIGPITLRVSWPPSGIEERQSWQVGVHIDGDYFSGGSGAPQSAGFVDIVVPEAQRYGQFRAEVAYVNDVGSGPSIYLYYYD